jgi:hypothetical protein
MSGSGLWDPVSAFCEHDNEYSGFKKTDLLASPPAYLPASLHAVNIQADSSLSGLLILN